MRSDLESRFSDLERYLNKHDGKYFVDDTLSNVSAFGTDLTI